MLGKWKLNGKLSLNCLKSFFIAPAFTHYVFLQMEGSSLAATKSHQNSARAVNSRKRMQKCRVQLFACLITSVHNERERSSVHAWMGEHSVSLKNA
jgi:hypothetical protein